MLKLNELTKDAEKEYITRQQIEGIILEHEIELISKKGKPNNAELIAVQLYKKLNKILNHIDFRINQVEEYTEFQPQKRQILLKELNRLKKRFEEY